MPPPVHRETQRPFRAKAHRLAILALVLITTACAGASQPKGPLIAEPIITTALEGQAGGAQEILYAADGYPLPLRSWRPEGDPTAIILGLHGFNDYSISFERPATYWADKGVKTYAFDQRGFGATDEIGVWPGTETLVTDITDALTTLKRRHPNTPLFLLGESMGGAAAILAMTDEQTPPPPIDGLILVAPAVAKKDSIPAYQRIGLRVFSTLMPGLKADGRGLDLQPSDNIDVLRSMWFDPLTLKDARLDTLQGLLDLMTDAATAMPDIEPPALMVFGAQEQIIPGAAVSETLAPLRGRWTEQPTLTLGYYPAGYHMLLRDLKAETVWTDILAWLESPTAQLPSGATKDAWTALLPPPIASTE